MRNIVIAALFIGYLSSLSAATDPPSSEMDPAIKEFYAPPAAYLYRNHYQATYDFATSIMVASPDGLGGFEVSGVRNPNGYGVEDLNEDIAQELHVGTSHFAVHVIHSMDTFEELVVVDATPEHPVQIVEGRIERSVAFGTLTTGTVHTGVVAYLTHVRCLSVPGNETIVDSYVFLPVVIPSRDPLVSDPFATGMLTANQIWEFAQSPVSPTAGCLCFSPPECCACYVAMGWCDPNSTFNVCFDSHRANREFCGRVLIGGLAIPYSAGCAVVCVFGTPPFCVACIGVQLGLHWYVYLNCISKADSDLERCTRPALSQLDGCLASSGCVGHGRRFVGPNIVGPEF